MRGFQFNAIAPIRVLHRVGQEHVGADVLPVDDSYAGFGYRSIKDGG
ncbi:hypothetical protein [Stieleria magnilauensis]